MSTFNSIYGHEFVRVASAAPRITVADPTANAAQIIALVQQAHANNTALVLFPELGISAYAIDELFHQQALLQSALRAIRTIATATEGSLPVIVIGAPLSHNGTLFNCAIVLHRGKLLG